MTAFSTEEPTPPRDPNNIPGTSSGANNLASGPVNPPGTNGPPAGHSSSTADQSDETRTLRGHGIEGTGSTTPGKSGRGDRTPTRRGHSDLTSLTQSELYQLNQNLLEEAAQKRPLMSEIQPLTVLRAEYEGAPGFVSKIDWLCARGWLGLRRTLGDGDCFYRSLAFSYIERILRSPDPDLAVASALTAIDATLTTLQAAGFDPMVYDDFADIFKSLIEQVVKPEKGGKILDSRTLLEAFQTPEVSNSIVAYLRLLTSAEIRVHPDNYTDFLFHPETTEPMDVGDFCSAFVESIGKEADHVQIQAITTLLRLNIKVAYLDGRGGDGVDFVNFFNGVGKDESGIRELVLLYRPGHYDILEHREHETQRDSIFAPSLYTM